MHAYRASRLTAAVAVVLALFMVPLLLAGLGPARDFTVYYAAADALRSGAPLPDGYVYPPALAVILWFIPRAAWLPLTALSVAALIVALRPWVGWWVAVVGVLCFPGTWVSLAHGQVNMWVAAIILVALRRQSGAWLALGAALKITPALLLVTLPRRQWWYGALMALAVLGAPLGGLGGSVCHPALVGTRALLCDAPAWQGSVLAAVTVLLSLGSPAALIVAPLVGGPLVWVASLVLALPALALVWQERPRVALVLWFLLAALPGPWVVAAVWAATLYAQRDHILAVDHRPRPEPVVAEPHLDPPGDFGQVGGADRVAALDGAPRRVDG